jgi:hypothetical protein
VASQMGDIVVVPIQRDVRRPFIHFLSLHFCELQEVALRTDGTKRETVTMSPIAAFMTRLRVMF